MWFNPIITSLLRSPLHRFVSGNMLVLEYQGRRSGKTYSLPVNYASDGDALWITSLPERTWWRNLRGGAPVKLWLRGRKVSGEAVVFEDPDEVAAGLQKYLAALPQAARYFGVELDEKGQVRPEDAARAAGERVMVKIEAAAGMV